MSSLEVGTLMGEASAPAHAPYLHPCRQLVRSFLSPMPCNEIMDANKTSEGMYNMLLTGRVIIALLTQAG